MRPSKPLRIPTERSRWLQITNMNKTYASSPATGGLLTSEARGFSPTQKTASYEIKAVDDRNNLVASCQALVHRQAPSLFSPTDERHG